MWNGRPTDVRYRFKRETLWAWIGPLVPETMIPAMRAIIPEQTRADRESERQAARDRAKEGRYKNSRRNGVMASNEERRDRARGLRTQGMSIRAIAAELGVSKSTIADWLR